jgi:uncharacterized protein (TIGR00369 family)
VLRERSYSWEDPTELAAAGMQRSGFDYLRAIVDGELPHPPVCATIGFRITEVDEGWSVVELDPGEHQYNPIGTVHGSVVVAALDSAAGNAVHSTLPPGTGYTTVQLSTTFLRPVKSDTGTLRCEGRLVQAGRRIALSEARLVGADDDARPYAHATATCMILGG